jgi:hypothetical protein
MILNIFQIEYGTKNRHKFLHHDFKIGVTA